MKEEIKKIEVTETTETNTVNRNRTEKIKDFAIKTLIIMGILILICVGIFGIIKIVPRAISGLASSFASVTSIFKPKEKITFSAKPQNIKSGQGLNLSWEHTSKSTPEGTYSISYPCIEGVALAPNSDGPQNGNLPCDQMIYLGKSEGVTVRGVTEKTREAQFPISVFYSKENSNEVLVKADTVVTITNESIFDQVLPTPTPTPSVTPSPSPAVINTNTRPTINNSTPLYNKADLAVRILQTGIIDRTTNQFIQTSIVDSNSRAAVRFEVINIGDRNSGIWNFNALLPNTSGNNVFNSENQISLAPGDRIEFTMGFDSIRAGTQNNVLISVDEQNRILEIREDNNSVTVSINTSFSNNGNNGNFGQADLSLRIIETGIIDRFSGQFIRRDIVSSGERAAVRFEVRNIGTQDSGAWSMNAILPTNPATTFTGDIQPSLRPTESAEFTMGFDMGYNGNQYNQYNNNYNYYNSNNTISITIDPTNRVFESREDNNTAFTTIRSY